jgi:hypothetical protein
VTRKRRSGDWSFIREHSLSLILAALVGSLLLLYIRSDSDTHLETFYGNALADWLGVFVFVIASKYFYEVGSGESRKPSARFHARLGSFLVKHSLTLFLALTGVVWAVAFARSDVDSKNGELMGNILSDWTQVLGLVLITKFAWERGSKEGR